FPSSAPSPHPVKLKSLFETYLTGTAAALLTELVLFPLENPRTPTSNSSQAIAFRNYLTNGLKTSISRAPATGCLMASYELSKGLMVQHVPPSWRSADFPLCVLSGIMATAVE
ncbi:hypothetical protein HDV05_007239, partial [Chytridiales sp. JEL 0842]